MASPGIRKRVATASNGGGLLRRGGGCERDVWLATEYIPGTFGFIPGSRVPPSYIANWGVRGHEKVPTGGQVEVPTDGQLEVPTLRVVS
jgi:hypothetical protein